MIETFEKLTKTQAILVTILSGMPFCDPKLVLQEISDKLQRPVNPIELASKEFIQEVQLLYMKEYHKLCHFNDDTDGKIVVAHA